MTVSRMVLIAMLFFVPLVAAQEAAQPPAAEETTTTTTTETASPYSGNWLQWPKMTGDWGGARTALEDIGIKLDIDVTQIMQGNAHGGVDTEDGLKYSGSGDLTLTLDTTKMKLWPGGSLIIHAEPVWGGGIDRKVGGLLPVNLDAALPGSAEPGFGMDEGCRMLLSEVIFQQVLFEGKVILLGGKLWGARAFDANAFANDERTQFMNVALRNNPILPGFLPYTNLGVGVIVNPTEWLTIMSAVADTQGRAKTTGFETTFHGPTHTSSITELVLKVKPFNLPGTQRVGFVWSSMEFPRLDVPPPGAMAPDNVAIYYNFDQYLYTEADDPTQGVGLFGRFGWARGDVNPVEHFYSIGFGGKGVVPTRDKDTFGIGYYHASLSHYIPAVAEMQQEYGVECYYSIEIAPWLHITPDLQIVGDPGGVRDTNDCAIVYGLRVQMNL